MMAASKHLLVLLMSLALFACGGSGSGGNSNPDIVSPSDPSDPDSPSLVAEGRAVKGVLSDATVNAYRFTAGAPGEWTLFAFSSTDANGYFDLDVSGESGPVLIEVLANVDTRMMCDVQPSCGEIPFGQGGVIPDDDFRLLSIIPSNRLSDPIAVTPLTHLAASWVEALSSVLPVSDSMAQMALARVADLFDLSPDFAHQLPIDLTSEADGATDDAVMHAVVSASFAQLAYGSDGAVSTQYVLSLFAEQFAELSGQLMLVTDDEDSVGVDIIRNAVEELLLALFDAEDRASLFAAVENLFSEWAHDPVTAAGGEFAFDAADYASALVLLDDLQLYLSTAGIDASGTFLATQMNQLNWLYQPDDGSADDTVDMVRVLAEGAALAVLGALLGFDIEGEGDCFDVSMGLPELGMPEGYASVCPDSSIRLSGVRHNQMVDARIVVLTSSLSEIQFSLQGNEGEFASLSNSTFTGELAGVLEIDLSGLAALGGSLDELSSAVFGLRLAGEGSLTRNSMPEHGHPVGAGDGFVADLDLSGVLNLGAIFGDSDEPLLLIQIDDGSLESPFGDQLFALKDSVFCEGRDPLRVAIGDESSLDACFGFEAFNLPEMHMTLGGRMSGLFELVGQLLAGFGVEDDLDDIIGGLDPSVLSLLGDARLEILDLERGTRDYRFELDNNRLRARLVNTGDTLDFYVTGLNGGVIVSGSTLVATVNADWSNLGASIHFADGSKRSYLLGPISDVVDENLINVLLNSLFAGFESIGPIIGPVLGGGLALPASGIVPCIEGC
ncbi:MAG: hypothetical protein CVV10_01350 [Gammaproteobacteria bacterium HGW-Gammaproteobacteria-14]|nr:MAG: hypothetical protein CVV10_01350 [Gammaproteobacteria bacterium HGW-Gammaproteobacteria-14]